MMEEICVKIDKREAERVRRLLLKMRVFDLERIPEKEGNYVFFPVKKEVKGLECVERKLKRRKLTPHCLKDALRGRLSEEEMNKVITSFDIIGDIAILEIPKELEERKEDVAKAVMEVHKNVKVVLRKASAMKGRFRVRKFEHLLGERRTITEHKENGCRFRLDVAKVYFSPRLAYERRRVAKMVKPGEDVLALFAGVGPYPIVIAKFRPDVKIIAIELNPDAVRYMKENIRINRVGDIIEVIKGDVREILGHGKLEQWADRIIMPLPKGAELFLMEAFKSAKKGCVIHFYQFGEKGRPYHEAMERLENAARRVGRRTEVLRKRIVRPYAPKIDQIVIDFVII